MLNTGHSKKLSTSKL